MSPLVTNYVAPQSASVRMCHVSRIGYSQLPDRVWRGRGRVLDECRYLVKWYGERIGTGIIQGEEIQRRPHRGPAFFALRAGTSVHEPEIVARREHDRMDALTPGREAYLRPERARTASTTAG